MTAGPIIGNRCPEHFWFGRIAAAAAFVVPEGLSRSEALAEIYHACDQLEALPSTPLPEAANDRIAAALSMARRRLAERRRYEDKLPPIWRRSTIRLLADLTCSELGAAIGVSGSTVAGWERGRSTPIPENARVYAEILRRIEAEFSP